MNRNKDVDGRLWLYGQRTCKKCGKLRLPHKMAGRGPGWFWFCKETYCIVTESIDSVDRSLHPILNHVRREARRLNERNEFLEELLRLKNREVRALENRLILKKAW